MMNYGWARALALCSFLGLGACAVGASKEEAVESAEDLLTVSGVTSTLKIDSDWGGGYCSTVTLANASSLAVSGWSVTLNLNGGTLANLWSGTGTPSAGTLKVSPASFNQSIASGGSVSFGFCANGAGRATIASMTVAGGGSSGSGGTSSGGSSSSGGASSGGATSATGGATSATGGVSASGGTTASGGTSASGGTTASGGSTSCTTPPSASPLVGWAAVSGSGVSKTTGGGSATPVTVTSLAALQSAVSGTSPAVIYVKGVLAPGKISVGSNKTVVGLCGAEIHGSLSLSGSVNVIIRNVKIIGYGVGNCALDPSYDSSVGCSSGNDAISVMKNAHHIWFDHCEIADGTDGNLDITNGANYVTVSWTKFRYSPRTDNSGNDSTGAAGHRYSSLIGGTDNPSSYDDESALNVTWHHNYWADNVVERQARVRFGRNHFFNNLWASATTNYCVRAGKQAHIHLENNVFSGIKSPHQFNSTSDQATAYISTSGNIYTNVSGTQATGGGGTAFVPKNAYAYTPDAASSVQSAVTAGVGPK